jgi:hypothetical protein
MVRTVIALLPNDLYSFFLSGQVHFDRHFLKKGANIIAMYIVWKCLFNE